MENLWAPWRMEYILSAKHKGACVFCVDIPPLTDASLFIELSDSDAERLIVYKGREMFVMLNRYPYAPGHLMIIPYRHVMDITELTDSESSEMMNLMQNSCKVLRKECNPAGINMGVNLGSAAGAGITDHLHFHVVPRWQGDSQFIAVISDVRLIPEHLASTQARFALAFREVMV